MNCPICGAQMEEGGLIIDGVAPGWVPMEEFKKRARQGCSTQGCARLARQTSCWARQGFPMRSSAKNAIKSLGFSM